MSILFHFPATSSDFSPSEEMEEVTDKEIIRTYRRESEQISDTLESISHLGKPSDATGSNAGTNELDLSQLVTLRFLHETEQARKGVRGSAAGICEDTPEVPSDQPRAVRLSPNGSARQEIVRKFYQLLRDTDAEGERVGTGLHRSHIWSGGSGNALNAAKAAESRTNAVRTLTCSLLTPVQFISTTLKAAKTRKLIFGGVDITGRPSGNELLIGGGISKLYHLICEGERVEENGTSWGFVYTREKIMLARGAVIHRSNDPG